MWESDDAWTMFRRHERQQSVASQHLSTGRIARWPSARPEPTSRRQSGAVLGAVGYAPRTVPASCSDSRPRGSLANPSRIAHALRAARVSQRLSVRNTDGMSKDREQTRRTGQARSGGRASAVVDRVVAATFAELSRVGYEAMRVEDVAALSGVNKTTIYRRWPTKAELLTSAVIAYAKKHAPPIDTGTLRGDLRASLLTAFNLRPFEQGILRVIQMERSVEEIDAFAQRMRDQLREMRVAMVRRGIERGELPPGVDVELAVDLISAPVQRALLFNESMDSAGIDRVLDLVLAGAVADASLRAKTSVRRKRDRAAGKSRSTAARAAVTNRSAAGARPPRKH
jgi:AcrR family transcriptional regulator